MSIRTDDPNLSDSATVFRRVWNTPQWIDLKALEQGILRPSSVAFLDSKNEVSVSVASMITPDLMLKDYPEFGLIELRVGVPRALDHIVSETPEIDDPPHRVICPPQSISKGKRKEAARRMASEIEWIVKPFKFRAD